MVAKIAARGALAGMNGARITTALGFGQVFDADGVQRSYSQIGGFSNPRRMALNTIRATGPDDVFTDARFPVETVDFTDMGYALEPGSTGFAVLVALDGQSNGIGATAGGRDSDTGDTATLYNTLAPLPGKMLCFSGGIYPLGLTGGAVAVETLVNPANIATVVDAADAINAGVQRDTALYSAGLMVSTALGANDKCFLFSYAVGSSSLSERLIGFTGNRATGTLSITGTSASITVLTGSLSADNLILSGAGIAADTYITTVPAPTGTGTFSVEVTPSQTVAPGTAFVTLDQPRPQKKNFLATLDAFAAWARGENLTPIMPFLFFIGGEAENTAVAIANSITTYGNLQTVADEFTARLYDGTVNEGKTAVIIDSACASPRYSINQDPSTNIDNDTPSLANMGLVNNMTLASGWMARRVDVSGVRYSSRFVSTTPYFQPADNNGRVHFGSDSIGHIFIGESLGLTAIQVCNTSVDDAQWPDILSVTRVKGSTSVTVTFSEACEFDGEQLVDDPGQYGFKYTGGGTNVVINGFSWAGAVLTLTLASEPTGTEVLSYACDNATLFNGAISRQSPFGPVEDGAAAGGYPWDVPVYGIGPLGGQRGNVRATAIWGYGVQTGRPLHRYALQYKNAVDVTAGTGTLSTIHATGTVAPDFLLDAGDSTSVPAGGQTFTDKSVNAALYWRGIDGTSANDPTDEAAAGSIPAWLRFDGGGGAGVKSGKLVMPQASPAYLANLHKAGGSAVLFAAIYMPTGPTYPNTQYILANCRNASGGGAGVAFRISTAGNLGVTVRGASNSTVYNHNLPTESRVVAGWNVIAYGLKDGDDSWAWDSNGSKYVATKIENATAYSSPSSGAAEAFPIIGGNYLAATVNIDSLVNGAGVGFVSVSPWVEAEEFLPIFRSACARFGLPAGPVT